MTTNQFQEALDELSPAASATLVAAITQRAAERHATDRFNGVEVKTELTVRRVQGVWQAKVSCGGLTDITVDGFATKGEALAWAIEAAR